MNDQESNIAGLLKQLRDDTTTLVREEVALAKTELSEKVSSLSRSAAFLTGGVLLAYSALPPLLIGIGFLLKDLFHGWGFGDGTSTFLGLLSVAVVVGLISVGIILNALSALKAQKLVPSRTISSLKADKNLIQNKLP